MQHPSPGDHARHSHPGAWPSIVWDTPLLRGLDARARAEIAAAGSVKSLRAGDVLYKHGDPADALFVVASGVLTLTGVRRGEANAAIIRRVSQGNVLGEEATVATFSTRQLEARCEADAVVAEVPLVVLRRAIGRAAGGVEMIAKVERGLRRAATLDLFRTTAFTRNLPDAELEVLLDAAKHVHVERGEHVYREGDEAEAAYLVADGLLSAQIDDEGKPRVEAYLARGDVFGDEELAERHPRELSVVANGPTWLVAIPRDVFVLVARRNPGRLEHARRLRSEGASADKRQQALGAHTTAHVFRDLYRMRVARSLLVIDQDACIRCGHCAWSCADAHADGVSRLVRRGDKIVVSTEEPASPPALGGVWQLDAQASVAPLLVPNSCQHCKNPSCMIDCPTGAIGRNARGEVFIREDLCTGCGSCAKACPWENIQMAPRKDALPFPSVAVKCDLCEGVAGGPACVSACPAQAIARIDPNAALAELRLPILNNAKATMLRATAMAQGAVATSEETGAAMLSSRAAVWPWALGALFGAAGAAGLSFGPWTSGVASGVLVALLVAYAAGKRLRGPAAIARLRGRIPLARYLYIAHVACGVFGAGVIASHASLRVPPNIAGALTIAIALAVVTGAVGALVSAFVPRALSRVERKSVLPEELAARPREIDERIFAALSGKSELVKTLFVKTLRPYRRSWLGPVALFLSRRTLREEERALRARVDVLTGGKKKGEALAGIDDLIRLTVEHRAVRLQRLLTWTLRGWLVPHLGATAAAMILLVLHVVAVSSSAAIVVKKPTKTVDSSSQRAPAPPERQRR